MKVLYRYISVEIIRIVALSTGLFLFIILMDRASSIAELILGQGVSAADFISVLLKSLPSFFGIIIPMSFVLSVLIAFIQMGSNNELIALKSCGISLKSISYPVFILGALFSLFSFYSLMFLAPKSNVAVKKEIQELLKRKLTMSISPKNFSSNFPGVTFYAERLFPEKGYLENFMVSLQKDEQLITIFGKAGILRTENDSVFLDIKNGSAEVVDWKKPSEFRVLKFKDYTVKLYTFSEKEKFRASKYKTLPQLISSGEIEAKVEIVKRTTLSLAPLIVGIIAFSIAVSIPRGSVGIGVITSLILIVSYYIVYTFSKKLALKTGHPLVAFIPDFVFGAVALFLYRKACEEKISVNVGARW